jgi:hypothetical protein
MGDVNYFSTRDHVVFICYKDMIKFTYPVLLYKLIQDYYDDLKDYLELDKIKDFDIYNLERICAERTDINPLKYIKKPNCADETCDLLLRSFNEEMIEIYTDSKFSAFGAKLYNLLPQEKVKEVYIYVEEMAHQVIIDCDLYFSDHKNKIRYLTGDFIKAVQCLPNKPTCYVLNDISYVHKLIEHNYIQYTEVIIGELGCNYELDENYGLKLKGIDESTLKDNIFKIGITPVVELEKKHFTNIDMSEFDDNK